MKSTKGIFFALLPVLLAVLLFFPSCKPAEEEGSVAVTGVSLNNVNLSPKTGENRLLQATVSPANATNKNVTWAITSPATNADDYATVAAEGSTGGRVSFLDVPDGDGKVTVTVTTADGGFTASRTFTVTPPVLPTGVTVNTDTISLYPQRIRQLTATVAPAEATNKTVTWSSSNPAVATVSNTGLVTAVAVGSTTITVTTEIAGKTATCNVTVKELNIDADLGLKDGLSGKTAAEYFAAKGLTVGWNVGNAMDAPSETAWVQPAISQELLNGVKAAGFNMIRLPITWGSNIGAGPSYTIDATRLNRVAEIVDYAYNAGLVVVINIHHDGAGGTGALNVESARWLSVYQAAQSESNYNAITAKFTAVWAQIADKFKDYGDWLIFEPFNEIHDGGWGSNPPENQKEVANKWNQVFTDTVRAAGGKNTERFLVVQPIAAKPRRALDDTFTLPTDTAMGKQIVSIHYYDPEAFALNGESIEWGTAADKNVMALLFAQFNDKFFSKGVPVIIGESGATYQNRTGADGDTANANRTAYMECLARTAMQNGLVPVLWDNGSLTPGTSQANGEMFGLLNRTNGTPINERTAALLEAMFDAVSGD